MNKYKNVLVLVACKWLYLKEVFFQLTKILFCCDAQVEQWQSNVFKSYPWTFICMFFVLAYMCFMLAYILIVKSISYN